MKKAIVFFVLTAVCWVLSIAMAVRFVKAIAEETHSSLAVVEAPGSAIFEIEEAGVVSLWHNYEVFQGGKTVSNDSQLPGGYSFELRPLGSAATLPFKATGMNTNFTSPSVSKTGLGTFEVSSPGDYELTVTAPAGQNRIISLSEGTMMSGFGKIFGIVGVAIVLGLIGLVTLVLGIVFIIAKPKSRPSIPSDAS
ncbi:MAG: hypothetical protein ACSHYB_12910 [Roseibacillus sp.]